MNLYNLAANISFMHYAVISGKNALGNAADALAIYFNSFFYYFW